MADKYLSQECLRLQVVKAEEHMNIGSREVYLLPITFVLCPRRCIPMQMKWDMQKQILSKHLNVKRHTTEGNLDTRTSENIFRSLLFIL